MRMTFVDETPTFEWSPIVADMILWEKYARQNGLPLVAEGPLFPRFTWTTFLAFAAMRREKAISESEKFDAFVARCAMPESSDDEDENDGEGDENPTI